MIDGIGLLLYKERLEALGITTLLERRARGDLIECFKIYKRLTNYGQGILTVSRSGYNLVKTAKKGDRLADYFPHRSVDYWNKLPDSIKDAPSVDTFKARLEAHKRNNLHSPRGHYWELSNEIFKRIETANRDEYTEFMLNNPGVASRRHIAI